MQCHTDVYLVVFGSCLRQRVTVCELAGRSTSEEQRHGFPWRRVASWTRNDEYILSAGTQCLRWRVVNDDIGKVNWLSMNQYLEGERRYLVGAKWLSWASCRYAVRCGTYNACRCHLNYLETIHVRFGDSVENRVAIIRPLVNKWKCGKCLLSLGVQIWRNSALVW